MILFAISKMLGGCVSDASPRHDCVVPTHYQTPAQSPGHTPTSGNVARAACACPSGPSMIAAAAAPVRYRVWPPPECKMWAEAMQGGPPTPQALWQWYSAAGRRSSDHHWYINPDEMWFCPRRVRPVNSQPSAGRMLCSSSRSGWQSGIVRHLPPLPLIFTTFLVIIKTIFFEV